jgi:hypothetical protein
LQRGREHGSFFSMDNWQAKRLTDTELKEFFDRLFPHGFTGADVMRWMVRRPSRCARIRWCMTATRKVGRQRNSDEVVISGGVFSHFT